MCAKPHFLCSAVFPKLPFSTLWNLVSSLYFSTLTQTGCFLWVLILSLVTSALGQAEPRVLAYHMQWQPGLFSKYLLRTC